MLTRMLQNFCIIFLFFCGFSYALIPPPYLVEHKTTPPNAPVVVKVGIDIYESFMNFETDTLTVHGSLRLAWRDIRKAYNSSDYNNVIFISGINDVEYRLVEKNLWVPALKQQLHLLTQRTSSYLNGESLIPFKDGSISYMLRFIMPISCSQESVNYPFETYSCYQLLLDMNANKSVTYKEFYPGEKILNLNFNSKHNGHKIIALNSSVFTKIVDSWSTDFTVNVPYVQFGFTVQRVSPRIITVVLIPAIAIGIIDALLFIFSRNVYLNIAMLPAFCIHFDDLTLKNTVEEFPPLVKFFYARFLTSILCNLWNFMLCISRKEKFCEELPSLDSQHGEDITEEDLITANISTWTLLKSFLSTWQRRMIVVFVFTILFYFILSMNLTLSATVVKEPNY